MLPLSIRFQNFWHLSDFSNRLQTVPTGIAESSYSMDKQRVQFPLAYSSWISQVVLHLSCLLLQRLWGYVFLLLMLWCFSSDIVVFFFFSSLYTEVGLVCYFSNVTTEVNNYQNYGKYYILLHRLWLLIFFHVLQRF